MLFRSPDDYRKFINNLRRLAKEETGVGVVAYCLTLTSFHLVLHESQTGAIAKFAHRLTVAYAMYFKSVHESTGKLFRGPYKETPLQSADTLAACVAQLHKIPVSFNIEPSIYQWSSLKSILSGNNSWLDLSALSNYFGKQKLGPALLEMASNMTPSIRLP